MNQQIKELALQAGFELHYEPDGTFSYSQQFEKFAELIVKKCAMIGNYAYDGGEYPGKMIKEYFGVEE